MYQNDSFAFKISPEKHFNPPHLSPSLFFAGLEMSGFIFKNENLAKNAGKKLPRPSFKTMQNLKGHFSPNFTTQWSECLLNVFLHYPSLFLDFLFVLKSYRRLHYFENRRTIWGKLSSFSKSKYIYFNWSWREKLRTNAFLLKWQFTEIDFHERKNFVRWQRMKEKRSEISKKIKVAWNLTIVDCITI